MLVVLAIVCLGCNNDDDNGVIETINYVYVLDSQIVINEVEGVNYASANDGENLVFEYEYINFGRNEMADDEYSETIIFEIPREVSSFEYIDDEIKDTKMHFTQFCYCVPEGSFEISQGFLKGSKNDDNLWQISFDVTFNRNDTENSRNFSGNFSLTSKPL